jgi:hypothetical protein
MIIASIIISSPPDLVFLSRGCYTLLRGLQVFLGRQVKPSVHIQLTHVDGQLMYLTTDIFSSQFN